MDRRSPTRSNRCAALGFERGSHRGVAQASVRIPLSQQHLQHDRARAIHHFAGELPAEAGWRSEFEVRRICKSILLGGWPAKKTLPSLAEVREAVREIRRSKGMLIVPGDDDCRSAGSFFKNPVLSEAQFKELAERAASKGTRDSQLPCSRDAQHKVSAAWLVEHSGFSKGYAAGAAGISHKHALALINRGDAKASDIVRLKDEIQRGVQEAWGILLEPEPVFVGFS